MTPDHARDALNRIVPGSSLPIPTGPRCKRCTKVLGEDAHDGYCSSDCRESERLEHSDSNLRELVLERDKGVCAIETCRLDCLELREDLDELRERTRTDAGGWNRWNARVHQLKRLGFDKHAVESGAALWEMDHDPPRVQGGVNTLKGVKTKCLACHKKATGELAGRRAAARKRRGFGR